MTDHGNRESWLASLADAIGDWYDPPLPACRIGVGFTSKGLRSKRIGECWATDASTDGAAAIFVHPRLIDPLEVAATVAHELIHASVGQEAKHGPVFKRAALAIGLTGKMTATEAGPEFVERIGPVLADLGPYPHAALSPKGGTSTGPKQTTRMLKVECACGFTVRMARSWIDDVGTPICPRCDLAMELTS